VDHVLASLAASGPVATVLFFVWWTQRKDVIAERDRHAAEEDRWRDKYVELVNKIVGVVGHEEDKP